LICLPTSALDGHRDSCPGSLLHHVLTGAYGADLADVHTIYVQESLVRSYPASEHTDADDGRFGHRNTQLGRSLTLPGKHTPPLLDVHPPLLLLHPFLVILDEAVYTSLVNTFMG